MAKGKKVASKKRAAPAFVLGDRVKAGEGDYCNAHGTVRAVSGKVASVALDSNVNTDRPCVDFEFDNLTKL